MLGVFLARFWPSLAIISLTLGLYYQIKLNGQQTAENKTLIGVNQSLNGTIKRLETENQLNEVLVVQTAGKREVIHDEVETIKYRVREIIRKAPDNDCSGQLHSPDIGQLLNSGG